MIINLNLMRTVWTTNNLSCIFIIKVTPHFQVTDWEGRNIDLAADEDDRRALFPSGGVLVTNRSVHDQILGLISSSNSVA